MNSFLVLLLVGHLLIDYCTAEHGKYIRTIHGYWEPPEGAKTLVLDAQDHDWNRHKRNAPSLNLTYKDNSDKSNTKIIHKIHFLNDTHKQLLVNWVGESSNVIVYLARDPSRSLNSSRSSSVYISYDYGDTYQVKNEFFKLPNGEQAVLETFLYHPKYNTHCVFTDVNNNKLYVTSDHGRNITRYDLNFTPSYISFHEYEPSIIVALDKKDNKVWISENYGKSFRCVHEMVKGFYWIKDKTDNQILMLQRMEPNGTSTVLLSSSNSSTLFDDSVSTIYATDVVDVFVKNDYVFTTTQSGKGADLELYVSYKLGRQIKCLFDTTLEKRSYFIVDVTSNRTLLAVSHADTTSHLYVSENLDAAELTIKFTLSLEDVLCYFPNSTWHRTWIHRLSEEAFADVFKVEGLQGIYIASRVVQKRSANTLGPEHVGSVITFDHGRSWKLIPAPDRDVLDRPNSCDTHNNCSLHLSQKFSSLYPDTRSIGILSSKSAPGLIIATGAIGKSLKGLNGVYVSSDAGVTWRQKLRDLSFFNMGDHGAILTAVSHYKSTLNGTSFVSYSTDEGETWKQEQFYDHKVRIYGLITEPGENTTVFTMFGSLPEEHKWIIIKLDFIKVFQYNCTKDDYETWSPSQTNSKRSKIPCILGQQMTFNRRMARLNCYNGEVFDAAVSRKLCGCDIYDYDCDFGFVRSDKAGNCVRDPKMSYDPYQIPDTCLPGKYYNRTKGYRKIQGDVCVGGFKNHYEPEEIPCPVSEGEDFLLSAQRERISRFNLVTKTIQELPVKKLQNVIAIDFDIKNNCVYWADFALGTIGRQCFDGNSSESEILVSTDLESIEGMALDWISNNLYFVDGKRSKIELIRTDTSRSGRMRRTILDSEVLIKPRGIALHPKSGYMFWTDWSTENPSVNRADLDGEKTLKLFGKPRVAWPNGITIDYIAERIYWVDAREDYIASSDLHGDYFKIIVPQNDVVSHPFAVAVFKNNIYWDDWKRQSIFSADKDTYKGHEVLQKLDGLRLMDLKVFGHGIRVGTNGCSNNTCEYICVGKPKIGDRACLCPEELELYDGKCMCPGGAEPFTNSTCPKLLNSCSVYNFTCGNGLCIPKSWRCNGDDDCGDNSDELQCDDQTTCPPSFFVCGDGKCLPQYWRCDYDADCADGSDELDCPKETCSQGQFTCANGRCISAKWKCDGENDCRDNSDEINCSTAEPKSCENGQFQCKSGTCIPPTWRCNGENDCSDQSDERDCGNRTCVEGQFACGTSKDRCIFKAWVCDGDRDCPDGRDELNCTQNYPIQPPVATQSVATNSSCEKYMFLCANKKCVPFWWKCDGTDDCGDGSDEIGCSNSGASSEKSPTTRVP